MAKISSENKILHERSGHATGRREVEISEPSASTTSLDTTASAETPPNSAAIDDEWFIANLTQLRALSTYILQEGIRVESKHGVDPLDLRKLNRLRPRRLPAEKGRSPTEEEWEAVDLHRRLLFGLLSHPQRRRFTMSATPALLVWVPLFFALTAILSLISAVLVWGGAWGDSPFLKDINSGARVLPFYLIWLMSLGSIGSATFIGMNLLSVQEDVTFDLSKWQLIVLRIVIGALFALVLTLPFGFQYFIDFCNAISMALPTSNAPTGSQPPTLAVPAVVLVVPFVLGFSTSLVILIMNRLVTAVDGFFGQSSATHRPPR